MGDGKNFQVTVPSGVNGQSYLLLTNCNTTVTDDTVVAGPTVVEVCTYLPPLLVPAELSLTAHRSQTLRSMQLLLKHRSWLACADCLTSLCRIQSIDFILRSRLCYSAACTVCNFDLFLTMLFVLPSHQVLHVRIRTIHRTASDRAVPPVAELV